MRLRDAQRADAASFGPDLGGAGGGPPEDFGDVRAEYLALRESAGLVDRSDRDLIAVTGPDRISFLQGMVSSDVAALRPGEGQWSLLLAPQGKLVGILRLLATPDAVLADCDPGRGEPVAAQLQRFLVRVKTQVDEASAGWACLSLWGPDARRALEWAGPAVDLEAELSHRAFDGAILVHAPLPGLPGYDVLVPRAEAHQWWKRLAATVRDIGGRPAGGTAATAVRVEAGVPLMGVDVDERTIPQEAGVVERAVSFTKGCYVGQELVARIDTRGHVNRHLRVLRLHDDVPVPLGSIVSLPGRDVGEITSVGESVTLRAPVGLALLRREAGPDAQVTVRWDGGSVAATVLEAPAVVS